MRGDLVEMAEGREWWGLLMRGVPLVNVTTGECLCPVTRSQDDYPLYVERSEVDVEMTREMDQFLKTGKPPAGGLLGTEIPLRGRQQAIRA